MKKLLRSLPDLKLARARFKEGTEIKKFTLDSKYDNLGLGKTYKILSYGCQGNEADSEELAGILETLGYSESVDAEHSDLVLINTCAIRGGAENRIWGVLGQLKGYKEKNKDMVIGVCGCMPQEEVTTDKLMQSYPFCDLIFGTHNKEDLPQMLFDRYTKLKRVVEVISKQGEILEGAPKHRQSKHKAWVNIMFGCDEFCTYCIVPYTRGKERSRRKEDIIAEVEELVKKGYKEVTLLGENVNAYGKDMGSDYTLGNLLRDLDKTGIARLRFTTSHPRDLDKLTMDAMAECKSVMPALHLPVQSGDNEVLRRMNRKYTHELYMDDINYLKSVVPGISITTDIIVAFPGETEEQFEHTIDLVKEVKFEGAFTFIYSPREGTPAATWENNLTEDEKKVRLLKLNEVVNKYYKEGNERFVGQTVEVLVDGESKHGDGMMCGYTPNQKLVNFPCTDMSLVGEFVHCKVTTAKTWFLIGDLID